VGTGPGDRELEALPLRTSGQGGRRARASRAPGRVVQSGRVPVGVVPARCEGGELAGPPRS